MRYGGVYKILENGGDQAEFTMVPERNHLCREQIIEI